MSDVPYVAQTTHQTDSNESSATAARAIAALSIAEEIAADHKSEWEHPEVDAEMDEKECTPSPPPAVKVPRPKRREKVKFCR